MMKFSMLMLAFAIGKKAPEWEAEQSVLRFLLEDQFLIALVLGLLAVIALAVGWKAPQLRKITYGIAGGAAGLAIVVYAIGALVMTEHEKLLQRQDQLIEACYPDPEPDWDALTQMMDENLELELENIRVVGRDKVFATIKRYLSLDNPPAFRDLFSDARMGDNAAESRLRIETSISGGEAGNGIFTSEWRIMWHKVSDEWIIQRIELLAVQTSAANLKNIDPG